MPKVPDPLPDPDPDDAVESPATGFPLSTYVGSPLPRSSLPDPDDDEGSPISNVYLLPARPAPPKRGKFASTGEFYQSEYAAELEQAREHIPQLTAAIAQDVAMVRQAFPPKRGAPAGRGKGMTIPELANCLGPLFVRLRSEGRRLTQVRASHELSEDPRQLRRWLHAAGQSWESFLEYLGRVDWRR